MTPNNRIVAVPATPVLPAPIPLPSRKSHPMTHPRNGLRELVETVVFVVVLVLLLKSFVAEAFVIPTGSMAETLYGHQKIVTCPSCAYKFPVNASPEDPQDGGPPRPVDVCICPNCLQQIHLGGGRTSAA